MNIVANLNWFDLLILIMVGLSVMISFFRGFVRELVSLMSWILAVILGIRLGNDVGSTLFATFVHSLTLQHILGFIVVLIGILILGLLLNMALRNLIARSGIGFADRFLGVAFGLARGILVVVVMVLLLQTTELEKTPTLTQSQLVPVVNQLVSHVQDGGGKPLQNMTNWITNSGNKVE
jgi:membrane protein required for colicin V production